MSLAAVSETIGLVSGIVGIVSGIAGTLVGVLSYRRQAAQSHPAAPVFQPTPTSPSPGSGAAAGPWATASSVGGPGLHISLKATLSAVLGIVAVLYASAVSLAASAGEAPGTVAEAAAGAFMIAIVALVLGLLARRDIRRHPERRGKLVSGLGIGTAVMAGLVAAAAAETRPIPTANPLGVHIEPTTSSVGGPLTAAGAAGLIASQLSQELQPTLQAKVQERFPGVGVVVGNVWCQPSLSGAAGTCSVPARDTTGGTGSLALTYEVINGQTGMFRWWKDS